MDASEWKGSWSNASEEWTPEWMDRLNYNFADQQLFWIEYKEFIRKYAYIDPTRIFDDDWTIAQGWVTVEVQRDDDHQDTSFDFTLHQKSLVVASLSQVRPVVSVQDRPVDHPSLTPDIIAAWKDSTDSSSTFIYTPTEILT